MKKQENKVTLSGPAFEGIGALLSASIGEMRAGSCLHMEEIAALVDGKIVAKERGRLMTHLSSCDSCYDTFLLTAALNGQGLPVSSSIEKAAKPSSKSYVFRALPVAASIVVALFTLFLFYQVVLKTPGKEARLPVVMSEETAPPSSSVEYPAAVEKEAVPSPVSSRAGRGGLEDKAGSPKKADLAKAASLRSEDDAVETDKPAAFGADEKAAKKGGYRDAEKKKGEIRPGAEKEKAIRPVGGEKGAPPGLKAGKGARPIESKKAAWEGEVPEEERSSGKAAVVSKKAKAKKDGFQAKAQPEAKLRERRVSREEGQQAQPEAGQRANEQLKPQKSFQGKQKRQEQGLQEQGRKDARQSQYARQKRDIQQYQQVSAPKNVLDPVKEEARQVQSANLGGILSQQGAAEAALQRLNRDMSRPGIISGSDMENYFKDALVLSRQLQVEYGALRKEAAAAGSPDKVNSYKNKLKPALTVVKGVETGYILPDIEFFLKKSKPGSAANKFFQLARSGWCDLRGCYGRLWGKMEVKEKEKILKEWQVLKPRLSGIFLEYAGHTIERLRRDIQ